MPGSSAKARQARPNRVRPSRTRTPPAAARPRQATTICIGVTVTMKSCARASAIGWLNVGGVQRSRAPCEMRRNSCTESATAAVAIRIGWPRRWRACSGAMTTRPDQHAPGGRDRRRQHEGECKAGDGIADPKRDRPRDPANCPIGAEHGDLAEGQIDTPDEAVDQRIGGREQRVHGSERERIHKLLQRIGGGRRDLWHLRCRRGYALPLRLAQPEALEIEEPRFPERALVGLDRHEVEPVALERGSAEATGSEVRLAARTRLRALNSQCARPSGQPTRGRPGFRGCPCPRGAAPAGSTGTAAAALNRSPARMRQARAGAATAAEQQAHGVTIREPPPAVAVPACPLALYLLSPHFLRSVRG